MSQHAQLSRWLYLSPIVFSFSLSRIGKLLKILRSNVVNEVVIKKESDCHGVYIVELFC